MSSDILKKALKEGGFYDSNHIWNSLVTIPGDNRLYRKRVETLIIRNGKEIFLKKKPSGEYKLPGGSTEKDIPDDRQAINECREEARINVKDIYYTGIRYTKMYDHSGNSWRNTLPIEYDGCVTDVYIAEYSSKDHGSVNELDQDKFIASGRFYPFKECMKIFNKYHREALSMYINNKKDKPKSITESYIGNFFSNMRLLKTIGKNPEVEMSAVDTIISSLKKYYLELKSSSKVKRKLKEKKKDDEYINFYPALTFTFPDNEIINIALCFEQNPGDVTDGAATKTKDYGYIVLIYPSFFNESKEVQRFTILHEIAHIRLGHVEDSNTHRKYLLFGDDDTNEYRAKLAAKGKSMYTEVNADLYAMLSGAKLYTILKASIGKDSDDEFDYTITNAELANRYSRVYKSYNTIKAYHNLFEFSLYDMVCLGLHDVIYESANSLSKEDKKNLFNFLYEKLIRNPIKESFNNEKDIFDLDYEKRYYNILMENSSVCENSNTIHKFIKEKNIVSNILLESIKGIHKKINSDSYVVENTSKYSIFYIDNLMSTLIKESSNHYVDNYNIKELDKFVSYYKDKYYIENTVTEVEKEPEHIVRSDYSLYMEMKRSELPDSEFGLIIDGERKYPLESRKHVLSAIRLFGHCPKGHEEELAKNILSRMRKYKIPISAIGEKNRLKNYITKTDN